MFLLYEYDIFWAFLIISIFIPILAFTISGFLAPINKGPEKLSSYESGIEPMVIRYILDILNLSSICRNIRAIRIRTVDLLGKTDQTYYYQNDLNCF